MKWFLSILVIAVLVLHQDFWNWTKIEPLWLGFIPIGLTYHLIYCVVCAVVMWLLVALAWPKHLEDVEPEPGVVREELHH